MTSPGPSLVPVHDRLPETGGVLEIRPGLLWARLPLPFRLDHINVWLLDDGDGWTVIDTGCANAEIRQVWETLLAGRMGGRPIRRVVATHGHVDHLGLSGELTRRFDAPFAATRGEWLWALVAHAPEIEGATRDLRRFYERHGCAPDQATAMLASRRRFVALATPVPNAVESLRDGRGVHWGGRDWTVMVTGGHAPEHAAFYCAADRILIGGDHVLPRISPIVSVYESEPAADPLADFLDSFARFRALPPDTMVLPSHGRPYFGLHTRLDQLEAHHRERLDATWAALGEGSDVHALARVLFPRATTDDDFGFAFGETLAHVNHLIGKGRVRAVDAAARTRFHRVDQGADS